MSRQFPYRWTVFVAAIAMFVGSVAVAQTDSVVTATPLFYLGGFGSLGRMFHSVDMAVPGFEECARFDLGTGSRWTAGTLVELPVVASVALQLRLAATLESGSFEHGLDVGPIKDRETGGQTRAIVNNVLDYRYGGLRFDLSGAFSLARRVQARIGFGFERRLTTDEVFKQVAVSPSDLLFAVGRREQEILRGAVFVPSSLDVSTSIGLAYHLPISRYSTLFPELSIVAPLGSRLADGDWRGLEVMFGLGLRFGVFPSVPKVDTIPDPPPHADTPVVAANPLLVPSITTLPDTVRVTIEERDSIEYLPLLNQVFFAEGSADLAPSYRMLPKDEMELFTLEQLTGSALDVYYHILNIIGFRMRQSAEGTLRINGYRNGHETDRRLSRRRAEMIRQYLVDVWGIEPRRLKVNGGDLPLNPAREITPQGFEENARVELIPSDLNITGPVVRRHPLRDANPPSIIFFPRAIAEAGVRRWRLSVDEGKRPWKRFEGTAPLPDSILWSWRSDSGALPMLPMRLNYRFTLIDGSGQEVSTPTRDIDVRYTSFREQSVHRRNDTVIETYSLLLFNYDSRRVSETDNLFLQAIAGNTSRGAIAVFTGYTDSLGEESHNRELANGRAREAARIYQALLPPKVNVIVNERGGERERFPYDTPEGRAHCRTVIIEVRTSSKDKGS